MFTSLDQIREYAESRAGGNKPFRDKTSYEKAWSNILNQVEYQEVYALDCIRKTTDAFKLTSNATHSGIYANVASMIETGLRERKRS